MENLHNHNSRHAKLRVFGGNMPVIHTQMDNHHLVPGRGRHKQYLKSPSINSCPLHDNNFIKLLLSKSPLSPAENIDSISPVMVNMEEETLVVDGISLTPDSGASSSGKNHHKRSTHRAGDVSSPFCYGSKWHHIHGKEEQHLTPPAMKNSQIHQVSTTASKAEVATFAANRPIQIGRSSMRTSSPRNWSPQDDGIQCILPSQPSEMPSREDVDSYIDHFLYGRACTTRLPVFTQICSP